MRPGTRRSVARLALTTLVLAGCDAREPARPEPGDARPNVLLVTVDTLRADRLGSYGYDLDTSPHMDALAAEGVVFERAIAASSATAPAHASIFTSRYVRDHSVGYLNGHTRLEASTTLAERFREAGYATGAFVGNAILRRQLGLDRGFDHYDDELSDPELNRPDFPERLAENTTRRALDWLEHTGGPWLLWVHYQDPHGPYTPPRDFVGRFALEPAAGERPLRVLSKNLGVGGLPSYQKIPGLSLPSEYEGRYADEIHYADHWIGELMQAVDGHASAREVVVLLTADHGESLGEGDRWFVHFTSTTPDQAHVPLVVRAPGLEAGRRRDTVSHVDVMPTLLELSGLAPPEHASGVALGPFLRAGTPVPARRVYCDIGGEVSAYDDRGFLRIVGAWLKDAWARPDAPAPEPERPLFDRFAWWSDGSWSRQPAGGGIPDPILQYVREAAPMEFRELLEKDRRLLRGLGYLDSPSGTP